MSESWGHVIGVVILLLMLVFVAVWFWAWSPHHKSDFEKLARLPMSDDEDPGP